MDFGQTLQDGNIPANEVIGFLIDGKIVHASRSNKQVIAVILLFLGAIVAVKVTLAVLEVVHEIPLLAPTLELIGLTYSIWFTYRYLWEAEKRTELVEEFRKIKNQVLGQGS